MLLYLWISIVLKDHQKVRRIKNSIQTFWNTSETYVSERESCLVVWGGLGWEHKQTDLLKNLESHRKYQWKSWTLSLLYTSADKYKSLEFYEKLLTLISCNFLNFGNRITSKVSGITSSSSPFDWILQILRICKLSRVFSCMKWAQFAVLACAPA